MATNYKVLASAQLTITDQTDAANLAGNMTIVNSTKSQVYLNGATNPFIPNWEVEKDRLVIRPYMVASSIFKTNLDGKYNPDLFDPLEYRNLTAAGYIKNLKWFLIDSSGYRKELKIINDETGLETGPDATNFSHIWDYPNGNEAPIRITDKRQLVVKKNILEKDQTASLLVSFSFKDPFANISIPVNYTIDIMCLSTGGGATKVVIKPVSGTSFYNDDPEYLLAVADYYKDGKHVDYTEIEKLLNSNNGTNIQWHIRDGSVQGGWVHLDPTTQDSIPTNQNPKCFEVCKIDSYNANMDTYVVSKTTRANGGQALKIYRGLIAGSDVIRATIEDGDLSGQASSAVEVYYDTTDPTLVDIDSSNGDKLVGGHEGTDRTVLKAVVRHLGNLLADDAPEYDNLFDYYWYRISQDGQTIHNMYLDGDGHLQFTDVKTEGYVPKKGARRMQVDRTNVNVKATFDLDLVDKKENETLMNKSLLLMALPSTGEFHEARMVNAAAEVPKGDLDAAYATSYEIKAYNKGVQDALIDQFYAKNKETTTEDKA